MRRLVFLLLFLLAGVASAAPSDADMQVAKDHYDKATRFYNVGEFQKAIDEYTAAYEITGAAGLLFNIAQAHRLAGDYDRARFFYNSYLRAAPNAANRADVEAMIGELDGMKREQPPGPPGPESQAASQPVQPIGPPPTPVGMPTSQPIAHEPPPPPFVPTMHPRNGTLAAAGRYTLIGGAAVLVVGVLVGIAAEKDAQTISDLSKARTNTWTAADQTTYERGRAEDKAAIAFDVIGSVAAVGGLAFWTYFGHLEPNAPSAAIGPVRGGAEAVLTCAF